ncbi:hypothetical protein BOTCAL_0116g00160 [Botryotinia calthae]|uniref:Uncharacterized protein n=1 Tax=Botryotinia calthae TaxID=38488 RepID=A0A4Y8D785_9HELO|nr:hypothetical protein BOTCAL_0116g00160 [Botryotinia calthae]
MAGGRSEMLITDRRESRSASFGFRVSRESQPPSRLAGTNLAVFPQGFIQIQTVIDPKIQLKLTVI